MMIRLSQWRKGEEFLCKISHFEARVVVEEDWNDSYGLLFVGRFFIIISAFIFGLVAVVCSSSSSRFDSIVSFHYAVMNEMKFNFPVHLFQFLPHHSHSHSIEWKFLPFFVYHLINILFPIPQKGVLGVIWENCLAWFPSLVCRKLIIRWDQTGNGWLYNCWGKVLYRMSFFRVCNSLVANLLTFVSVDTFCSDSFFPSRCIFFFSSVQLLAYTSLTSHHKNSRKEKDTVSYS